MPWRLIGCIIILVIVLAFIGFNLDNRCDVSFGPGTVLTLSSVPIYFTIFVSFVLGMLCSLPFIIGGKIKKGGIAVDKPVSGKAEPDKGGKPENQTETAQAVPRGDK